MVDPFLIFLQDFATLAVERNVQKACSDGLSKAHERFLTEIPDQVSDVLASTELPRSLSRRFAESPVGLLLDDLKCLPDQTSRFALFS